MLPQKLIEQLRRLEADQNKYKPSDDLAKQLEAKTIVLVIGPSCAGKSTVIREVVRLDPRFGLVGSFTTRLKRADEGGKEFTYIPHNEEGLEKLFARIEKREIIQYSVYPTTKNFYGTDISDYPKDFNILDTAASSVAGFRHLPFKASPAMGLVVEASQWQAWFDQRFPVGHPERGRRVDEAVMSLSWLLNQSADDVSWVINEYGKAEDAAREVIRISLGESKGMEHGRKYAELCYEAARRMQ
jgi:guanylate kinase